MKRTFVVALIVVIAALSLASPAMAQGSKLCSFLGGINEVVGGAMSGVIENNCGAPATTPPANAATPSGNPTTAAPEPLVILGVGLGLLGARFLRRR